MSLQRLMTQPLTVQAMGPTTQDAYGDWISGALGTPVAALGYLEQTSSIETTLNRDTTVSAWTAYLPAAAGTSYTDTFTDVFSDTFGNASPIGPLSVVTFGGQKFQVDGQPWAVFNPRTKSVDHVECKLLVVSG